MINITDSIQVLRAYKPSKNNKVQNSWLVHEYIITGHNQKPEYNIYL